MFRLLCLSLLVSAVASVQSRADDSSPAAKPAAHSHDEHGPHGGELIEIGHGEYHAELVLSEPTQEVTIYLLDGSAKAFVAVNSPSLVVNFKRGGKPFQVKLVATPQEIDEKGFSSRYAMKSPELMQSLHDAKADPRFGIRISNKSYIAKLTHSHDHSHGHDHHHDHSHDSKKVPAKK